MLKGEDLEIEVNLSKDRREECSTSSLYYLWNVIYDQHHSVYSCYRIKKQLADETHRYSALVRFE